MDVELTQEMTGHELPQVMQQPLPTFPLYFATFVTVKAVNKDTLTVDICLGKNSGDLNEQPEYKEVPVMLPVGVSKQGAEKKPYGHIRLPQVGSVCVMMFLNGNIEHRFILGQIYYHHDKDYSEIRNNLLTDVKDEGDDVIVHESGTKIIIRQDGTVELDAKTKLEIKVKQEASLTMEKKATIDAKGDVDITTALTGSIKVNGGAHGAAACVGTNFVTTMLGTQPILSITGVSQETLKL